MRDSALTHGLPGPQEINSEPQIRCVPLVLYWYMGTGTSNVQCTCTLDQSKVCHRDTGILEERARWRVSSNLGGM